MAKAIVHLQEPGKPGVFLHKISEKNSSAMKEIRHLILNDGRP